jgi:DNA-binding CsgD family transcriptional regulator
MPEKLTREARPVTSAATPGATRRMRSDVMALQRSGRFRDAMSMLDRSNMSDPASLLLRARISIEISPSGAIGLLEDPRFLNHSLRDQAEATMLRGLAHARLGECEAAERCYEATRVLLSECGVVDADLLREVELSLGALLVAQSRVDEAGDIANALSNANASSSRAATYMLLARVALLREHHEETAGYVLQALRAISADPLPDVPLWAETLRRLASVHIILASPSVHEAVMRQAMRLPWTEELADAHSSVYRLLGTREVIDGAISEGMALLKSASAIRSATLPNRIGAMLAHAEVSKWLDEPFACEEYLLEATVLAEQIDWRTLPLTDREILLLLAEMHAHRDSALALSFAAQFESLGGFGIDSIAGIPTSAQQNYCLGLLNVEIGEPGKGVPMLEAAYEGFAAFGMDWAAGQSAILLAEATNSLTWRSRARERLAAYPNSFLKERLARLDCMDGAISSTEQARSSRDAKIALLTRAQLVVYYRLLKGDTIRSIAVALDRSENTVRNHIQAIFKKFEVGSRAGLVLAAHRPAVAARC